MLLRVVGKDTPLTIDPYCLDASDKLSPDEREAYIRAASQWLRTGNDIYCGICRQSVRDVVVTDDSLFLCRACAPDISER